MRLSTKHRELMPKHDDLQLLELPRARTKQGELQEAADQQIAERPEQAELLGVSGTGAHDSTTKACEPGPNRVNAPHTRMRRPVYWTRRPLNEMGKARKSVSSCGQSKPSSRYWPVAMTTSGSSAGVFSIWSSRAARARFPKPPSSMSGEMSLLCSRSAGAAAVGLEGHGVPNSLLFRAATTG